MLERSSWLVGVHMRRGDFKDYADGRYYYSLDQYGAMMRSVRDAHGGDVVFLVCSNEPVSAYEWPDLDIETIPQSSSIEDWYALTRCDALFGLSGAPTVIGDYVVTGGLDGRVYVVERKTGKLAAQWDTARTFPTINGIEGNGASVDNASIIAVNGLLIMNSGYGLFGQGAGNVMIAYKPKN